MPVKTTVILRDDVYEYLVKKFGRRKISKAVNEAVAKRIFRPSHRMFGADPWLNTKRLRDEDEPHETS